MDVTSVDTNLILLLTSSLAGMGSLTFVAAQRARPSAPRAALPVRVARSRPRRRHP